MRDSQRQKVYDAERQARDSLYYDNTVWSDVKDIQIYVDKLLKSAWYQTRSELPCILVQEARANKRCATAHLQSMSTGVITLPIWAYNELTVLHEIVHCILQRSDHFREFAGHGREFTKMYLQLVKRQMRNDVYETLLFFFKKEKVRYRKKHTRPDLKGIKPI